MRTNLQKKAFVAILSVASFFFLASFTNAQSAITDIGGYKLIISLPGVAGEAAPKNLAELVRYIYLWLLGVVALAAGVMLLAGGVRYFLAAGNPGKAQDAREQVERALLGFLVVLGSYLILNTINPSLVNLSSAGPPKVDKTVAKTFLEEPGEFGEGECVANAALAGGDCTMIGNGWIDYPEGCADACSSSQRCCLCTVDTDCAPKEHTCVRLDDEGNVEDVPDDPVVCGPFLRADCLNPQTGQKCPPAYPMCVDGGYCSDQPSETISFKITYPLPPTGGNTVTPVTPDQPLNITVEAPSTADTVAITVTDPSNTVVFTGACNPAGGVCGVMWGGGVSGPGNFKIVAEGKDKNGNMLSGMRDTRLVCGESCGPTASFTISAVGGRVCADGSYETNNGTSARLRLDASASSSPQANQLSTFEWTDENMQPFYFGTQPAPVVETTFVPGPHAITLIVTDQYGARGTTSKNIEVVVVCP